MRADLKLVETNDHRSWEDFVTAFHRDGPPQRGWFSVEVGLDDGTSHGEWFQVLICTHAEAAGIKKSRTRSRYIVADIISPEGALTTLREYVSRIRGDSWIEIQDTLRKSMWWERETIPAAL